MARAKSIKAKRTATVRSGPYEYTVIFEPAAEGGYVVTAATRPLEQRIEDEWLHGNDVLACVSS